MPISVQGPAWKGSSVPFGILALSIPVLCYIVQSGDNAKARKVIDTNDDGVLSLPEEGYAKRFVAGIPKPYDERLEQAVALKKAIIEMSEERKKRKG